MKIIVAFGGLGNVLFYYALDKAFRMKGVKSFVFISKTNIERKNYNLKKVFPKLSRWGNLNTIQKFYYYVIQQIRNFSYNKYKMPHKVLFYPFKGLIYDQEPVTYIPSIFNNLETNQYFIGHFQSYKYFEEYREYILQDFQFSTKMLSKRTKQVSLDIVNCNSVSLHVRRGDYLNGYYFNTLGKVCGLDYYKRAVEYLKEKLENPHFFVFSDDPEYVAENLQIKNATYIDFNIGDDSWQDMYLMSQCNHNIIANSTFSWWGAWLNENPQKIVVAPNRWFANMENDEIVLPEWIRL
jgi:hypothetical protein